MRKSLSFLVLFFALAASAAEITRFGVAQESALPLEGIKVLVWNTYQGGDNNFTYDYRGLADTKHLALLQEANLTQDMRKSLGEVPMGYTHAQSFRSAIGRVRMGVATGSVAKDVQATGLVSPVREVRSTTRKAALIQHFALEGRMDSLMVTNVHAINFVPNGDFVRHIEQIAAAMLSHEGPMLVGGDFNTWNVQRLHHLDRIFGRLGLTRVIFPPGRTRFPNIGVIFGVQTGGELDQVYTRGLNVTSRSVNTDVTSSDHQPLELQLSVL